MAGIRLMGSFVIRRACQSDAVALSNFAARLFRATYSSNTAAADLDAYIYKNFNRERQEAEIVDLSAAVFLATIDDLIIGFAQVVVGSTESRSALLNRICIDAEWRGSGLANDLLDTVVSESAQRGVTRLELTVFERNARAIAFYKRAGFAATGSTTFAVGDDLQTDVVMEMDLEARFNRRPT
ncbi:GNAT family N-acetyltransferase [Rhizobium leguminosarum]|uniref:Acetyltransferase n=1 Tax=Rhizobium leguminosarum TaxID=384 RepID=A0A179BGB8_RHILE|nr:GNAT family N-acetyltransferase [Rhizobium leguminosarum]OAP90756.1 acetyltransferase [Rhizobium leguminosarum]